MDKEQFELFRWVYPWFKHCTIQTFNDCKDSSLGEEELKKKNTALARKFEVKKWVFEKLDELNKQWAWIFFSVNQMKPWERNKDSVAKYNSWICDIDAWTKEEQMKRITTCPLQPSLCVESWHWYHLYYFCAEDITSEQFHKYNRWLCNYFHWDEKIPEDDARVLRIPWYYHMKDPQNPFLVSVICWTNKKYTLEEMAEAFPNTMTKKEKKDLEMKIENNEMKAKKECENDWFWWDVCNLNAKDMLEYLSWSSLVWWDNITFHSNWNNEYQIYCNWKSTSCRIDANWYIGSSDWWGPTWIRRLAWYWPINRKEVYKIVEKTHPELIEKYAKKPQKKEIKEEKREESQIRRTTDRITRDFSTNRTSRWLDYIDDNLWKFDPGWELVVLYWLPWSWKTEICFFIARHSQTRTAYFCLEIPEETIIKRRALRACGYTRQQVDNWQLSILEQERLQRATDNFKNSLKDKVDMISINQQPTVEELMDYMQRYAGQGNIIIIDNLWKIKWDDNEIIRFEDISAKLQTFAYKTKSVVILQHHASKPPKAKNADPNSVLEEVIILWPFGFRWSEKIHDNATRLVEIYRDRRNETTWLLQYKHTPTDTRWWVSLVFEKWEFKENI